MHIEPGFVSAAKVMAANAAAVGVVLWAGRETLRAFLPEPWIVLKAAAAALFFSLFMQSFSTPVGPSELHFVGAMAMYLTLGFLPTLLGFAFGLALQGVLFDPADLAHLGVNSLSLILPLAAVHYAAGRRFFARGEGRAVTWARVVKLDAMYYAGVTGMVGFWLMIGETQTPFLEWAAFAASYLAVVALEPVVTLLAVRGLKAVEDNAVVARLFVVRDLRLA